MNKGFNYTLEREDLLNYMKLSVEEKLIWLEEIVSFTEKVMTTNEKKIRDHFRNYGNCRKFVPGKAK